MARIAQTSCFLWGDLYYCRHGFLGGEGLASFIASDLRGPAIAPGFSFFGACLLGLKRSKYYMLNRSECHALGAEQFPRLTPEPIRNRSGSGRQGAAAISSKAKKDRDYGPSELIAITREWLLEIEKRNGARAFRVRAPGMVPTRYYSICNEPANSRRGRWRKSQMEALRPWSRRAASKWTGRNR